MEFPLIHFNVLILKAEIALTNLKTFGPSSFRCLDNVIYCCKDYENE